LLTGRAGGKSLNAIVPSEAANPKGANIAFTDLDIGALLGVGSKGKVYQVIASGTSGKEHRSCITQHSLLLIPNVFSSFLLQMTIPVQLHN